MVFSPVSSTLATCSASSVLGHQSGPVSPVLLPVHGPEDPNGGAEDNNSREEGTEDHHGGADDHNSRVYWTKDPQG